MDSSQALDEKHGNRTVQIVPTAISKGTSRAPTDLLQSPMLVRLGGMISHNLQQTPAIDLLEWKRIFKGVPVELY
jgi:hypothetical protein